MTSVLVTHDQEEALEVSDRVVIMNEGRIEQSGTPEEVYEQPATPFVYGFLGDVNLFHGRIHQGRVAIGGGQIDAPGWADAQDQAGVAYVRTYEVELGPSPMGDSSLEAVVRHIRAFGPVVRLELDLVDGGRTMEAQIPRDRFEALALACRPARLCRRRRTPECFPGRRHRDATASRRLLRASGGWILYGVQNERGVGEIVIHRAGIHTGQRGHSCFGDQNAWTA